MLGIFATAALLLPAVVLVKANDGSASSTHSVLKVDHHEMSRRYDYKQSVKSPFMYGDSTDIPYFSIGGRK
jgi:hypothetical protein